MYLDKTATAQLTDKAFLTAFRWTRYQKQKDVTSQMHEVAVREQPPSTFLLWGCKTRTDFHMILCMAEKPYLFHGLKPSLCLSLSVL